MKKINLVLIFLLLSFITVSKVNAQAALFVLIFGDKVATKNFHLSLDMGINISNMSGFSDGKNLVGINFGLGTHIRLNDKWSMAPEFKPVSTKGAREVTTPIELNDELDIKETSSKIKLKYIEVPILLQHRFSCRWYISAGPQLSFLTSAKQETEIILTNKNEIIVGQDLKSNFNKFNWSIPIELAYTWKDKRGGKGMDIRARYSYSFNETFDDRIGLSANHSTFQLIVTFPFVEEDTTDQ